MIIWVLQESPAELQGALLTTHVPYNSISIESIELGIFFERSKL